MNVRIDFIAGHALQAQAAQSVYEALADRAQCQWQIGRPIAYTGAEAAVLVDHVHQHPDFKRWPQRFYLLHDLGDIAVYKNERDVLRDCTAVIVPDEIHARVARRHLLGRWWRHGTDVFVGGWPKYDQPAAAALEESELPTLLYAPTWSGEDEWRKLLPALTKLPLRVVIKNHTYATAPGEEASEYYQYSRRAVIDMEQLGRHLGFTVLAPDLNICTVFPQVDAIMTDQSSVAAEFLPWGVGFETGAHPKGKLAPGISALYAGVLFRPLELLLADIQEGGQQLLHDIESGQARRRQPPRGAGQKIADMIWEEVCPVTTTSSSSLEGRQRSS